MKRNKVMEKKEEDQKKHENIVSIINKLFL